MGTFGQVQLSVRAVNEATLSIHVVKATGLRSSLPLANAFITVGLLPVPTGAAARNPQSSMVVCSNNPSFNELLNLDIGKRCNKSRLFVAVWNKLPDKRPAELIGAMSFSIKQCLTEPFSGWYHLLDESLAMNKHLRTESPEDPQPSRMSRVLEERLYENTTEQHYEQPRKLRTSIYSEGKIRSRRRSSLGKPAPRSRPPPIPGPGSVSSSDTDRGTKSAVTADDKQTRYQVPSKSLYKRPNQPEGRARPVKVRSREDVSGGVIELAKFHMSNHPSNHKPVRSRSSASTRSSSMDRQSSRRGSTQTLDKLNYAHCLDTTVVSRPQGSHPSMRRVKRQALFRPSLTLSPDSSLSSSDSMAAWNRLNSDGAQFVPYLLHIPRGTNGFGFSISDDIPAAVCHVEEESDAERAGLRVHDRLIEVQGEDLSNATSNHVAAIIRHQTKMMKLLIWRPLVTDSKAKMKAEKSALTPLKRSGSRASSAVVSKKHRQHKEKRSRSRRDAVADGVSMHEQPNSIQALKSLDMLTYLYEQESEFCDAMRRSYRFHSNELQLTGKVGETETYVLFQNMDMLISMSQYFAGKLEIVVRHAADGKRMIATAPEIYSPRVELIKQNYIKYIEGIKEAEQLKALINTDELLPAVPQGVLSLDELLHNPLHHIQKVLAAFNILFKNVENSNVNLPQIESICSDLQECVEKVNVSAKANKPPVEPQPAPADPELIEIQKRLEFPPHIPEFDLCRGTRHKLYWSEVKVFGEKQKMVAYLFSDMVVLAKAPTTRGGKLIVEREPVRLSDVIDAEYGTEPNDCELTLHYMVSANQRLSQLSLICGDIETKLVWKGLLKDRLLLNRTAELNYSDQLLSVRLNILWIYSSFTWMAGIAFLLSYKRVKAVYAAKRRRRSITLPVREEYDSGIQVSESSEGAEGEEPCCDLQDLSPPFKGRVGDGLSDSMTAIADDLCSSNQLRNNSSGETTADCLQLADYMKHEAKQAMTVAVSNNNNNCADNSPADRVGDGQIAETEQEVENPYIAIRIPPIDLSAITEEADDLTNTSMYLSCSHEATPSECASTPIDKSFSSHSTPPTAGSCCCHSPRRGESDLDSAGAAQLLQICNNGRQLRSFSNPELFSDELSSRSMIGFGEDMCTPTSSQKPSDFSLPQTDTTESFPSSGNSSGSKPKLLSDENLNDSTFDSQRCQLPCHPAKASFTLGESPTSSPPSTPCTPLTSTDCTSSSRLSFVLPHVESDAKLSKRSPVQRKTLGARIRRSKSYSNTAATPSHARFLQQQMTQLTMDQNSGKSDSRQRKFSAVAKNVRNVLGFFKRRPSEPNAPIPTLEIVESWSQNFSNLLNDKYGLMLFRSFLLSEYSEENIEFWIACEEYKRLKARQQAQRAQTIYSDFVTVHAPKEVNLDSRTRMETMKALNNPSKVTFDLAQSRIQCLMEKDSYTRFLKSSAYTSLLSQARSSATPTSMQ